jgi:hypothetical protein
VAHGFSGVTPILNNDADLSHSRIALPLNGCHFAGDNIDIEWAAPADSGFAALRNCIVTGRQRNSKSTAIISREGNDRPLFICHGESTVGKRRGTGDAFSGRPGLNRTNRNRTLQPCRRFGLCLP